MYNTMKDVLAAVETKQKELANLEQDAIEALQEFHGIHLPSRSRLASKSHETASGTTAAIWRIPPP